LTGDVQQGSDRQTDKGAAGHAWQH
jgi:hypothetical protein